MKRLVSFFTACTLAVICLLPGTGRAAQRPSLDPRASVRVVGTRAKVNAIVQDARNFIWTAGDRGLCRFDGLAWTCPLTEDVVAMAPDHDGGLWIVSKEGVGRLDPSAGQVSYLTPHPGATLVAVDGRNKVWIGTQSGLFSFDREQRQFAPTATVQGNISALVTEAQGGVVVAAGERLFRVHHDDVTEVWHAPAGIRTMACARNGDIIAALRNYEVWRLTAPYATAHRLPVPLYPTLGPVVLDAENRLWLGDRESLMSLDDLHGELSPRTFNLSLSTFLLNALMTDREGSLWIGSDTGLLQIRFDQPLRPLSAERSLSRSDMVFSVAEAPNGDIWAATLTGLARWNGSAFADYDHKAGLIYPDIRSVAVTKDGAVWAAGLDTGVFRREADRFVSITDAEGARIVGASAVRPRMQGGVWVGLWHGGFGMVNGDSFTWLLHPSDVDSDRVVDLQEAPDGTLWLITERDGVLAWKGGTLKRYGPDAGIPKVLLLSMHSAADGALWIGTDGAGLLRFDGTHTQQVTKQHGLDDDRLFSILEDQHAYLWLGSPRGLSVIATSAVKSVMSGKEKRISGVSYGPEDGLVAEPMHRFPPPSTRASDGTLLFATAQGIVIASPSADRKTKPAQVVVNSVMIDGQRAGSVRELVVVSGTASDLTVDFSAPTFIAAHRLRFRYQLQGLSGQWFETNTGHIRFDHLPRGQYRLLLQAYHPGTDDEPAKPVDIKISLVPPWYARTDMRVAALALALFTLGYWLRSMKKRREQAHSAVLAERARIAHEIHDGLEQDLAGLRLQIEVVKQSLLGSPEKVETSLQRAGELINDASSDLRIAIWRLQLDATTTSELVRTLGQRLARSTDGTPIQMVTTADGPSRRLNVGVATHVVSIAREAVANALKHASPTRISVVLDTTDARQLVLSVTDDGKSVSSGGSTSGGMGVAGMKARARAVNGALEILRPSEGGTCVRLRAPLGGQRMTRRDVRSE